MASFWLLSWVIVVYSDVVSISPISERFVSGVLSEDFTSRLDIWRLVVANPPRNILFGSGSEALFEDLGATPHNGYLDAFYCWGLFGIFMFSWLTYTAVKWSRSCPHKHDTFRLGLGLAWGLLWGLVTLRLCQYCDRSLVHDALTAAPFWHAHHRVFAILSEPLCQASGNT